MGREIKCKKCAKIIQKGILNFQYALKGEKRGKNEIYSGSINGKKNELQIGHFFKECKSS